MEKFYIVPEGTKLHRDFTAWEACEKELVEAAKIVMESNGMETTQFVPGADKLGIVPTQADLEKFGPQLCKTEKSGVVFFKKNSAVNKEWLEKTEKVQWHRKPFMVCYFSKTWGRSSSRLFRIGGTIYCSLDCNADFEPLEPFQEIKASEFWKVIEDYEAAQEAKEKGDLTP